MHIARRSARPLAFGGWLNGLLARATAYDVVRIAIGAVLLSAAALKAHDIVSQSSLLAGESLFGRREFAVVIVGFELFLGLWLLRGIYPFASCVSGLGCFLIFGGVAFAKAVSGEPSCGCFGRVELNPWFVVTGDLAVVATLGCCCAIAQRLPRTAQARGDQHGAIAKKSRSGRTQFLILAGIAFSAALVLAWLSRDDSPAGLIANPSIHDLGSLAQDETVNASFLIKNTSNVEQVIEHTSTSCSCTDLKISSRTLTPGESTSVDVSFNSGAKRGKISEELLLLYKTPQATRHRYLTLEIRANVRPQFTVKPDELRFTASIAGRGRLRVQSQSGERIEIIDARCTHPAFRASVAPAKNAVEVEFDPAKWPEAEGTEQLVLHINSNIEPRFTVLLSVSSAADGRHATSLKIPSQEALR